MTEQSLSGRRRGRRAAVACVAALIFSTAAACSSADNPAPEPLEPGPSAASATPSKTPSPSGAPSLPPEARGTSDKAAIAFVEHCVSLFNYSTSALSTEQLDRVSDPDGAACNGMVESIDRVAQNGGHIRGDGWIIDELEVLPNAL